MTIHPITNKGTILMSIPLDTQLTHNLRAQMPLAQTMRVSALEANHERVVMTATWRPEFCGVGGVLHGGYLMSLADGGGATLAFLNLELGTTTTTVESKTNFFRPVTAGTVRATSTLLHRGRNTVVTQTETANESGALVARTTQTQLILPKKSSRGNEGQRA